jgi:hypothetical protein
MKSRRPDAVSPPIMTGPGLPIGSGSACQQTSPRPRPQVPDIAAVRDDMDGATGSCKRFGNGKSPSGDGGDSIRLPGGCFFGSFGRTPAASAAYGVAVIDLGELKIPKALRQVAGEIVDITDSVCLGVLDEEYADLARQVVAKLARKRPSPLAGGRRATWAAGVVYALGQVNYLFDPSEELHVTADQLSEAFGVAKSTMSSKAKLIRDLLRISPFSSEFQRVDIAARNPLLWFISVDGLVMDARNVPLEIQIEAFEGGCIPYVPALGPDGTAYMESWIAGTADATASSEVADLLERCSELKRQLVQFARSQRFSQELDEAIREGTGGTVTDEREIINVTDRFILQQPLADGRTVVEIFVAEHPELNDADRQLVLGWRDVVEGVFEICEVSSDSIIAVNLADELTYRIRSNAGHGALALLQPGFFITGRVVPVGGDWMVSGMPHLFPASERAEMLRLAAELA